MTEAQWLTCKDTQKKLEFLRGKASDRKLRLFNVGCCRRIWSLIATEPSKKAVEVSEKYADGSATFEDLRAAWKDVFAVWNQLLDPTSHSFVRQETVSASLPTAHCGSPSELLDNVHRHAAAAVVYHTVGEDEPDEGSAAGKKVMRKEFAAQSTILRDIFGNPFHPVLCDRAWRTRKATKLAKKIYNARAFDRMPELGEELKRAGCNKSDVLKHCKQGAEHARGCWVVDLLLDRN